jgi:hypothetical protein
MKATYLLFTLLFFGLIYFGELSAQHSIDHYALRNDVVYRTDIRFLTYNEDKETIKINYKFPDFTYSANLIIEDFTGRAIKSFKVCYENPALCEFDVDDLLPGNYYYTLILNDQQQMRGKFRLNEDE